jgi:hypothetical protein
MRCFQDPTEVEWIEDKLWSQRLDEGWDLAQVGTARGGAAWCDHCAANVDLCALLPRFLHAKPNADIQDQYCGWQ